MNGLELEELKNKALACTESGTSNLLLIMEFCFEAAAQNNSKILDEALLNVDMRCDVLCLVTWLRYNYANRLHLPSYEELLSKTAVELERRGKNCASILKGLL